MPAFFVSDAFTKALDRPLSVFEIGFFDDFAAALVLLATRHENERWRVFWKMKGPWPIHVRALCDVVSSLILAPFFVTTMSILILKEQVGLWRWFAVALGFVNVFGRRDRRRRRRDATPLGIGLATSRQPVQSSATTASLTVAER